MMGREGEVVLVNGQHQPQMSARAGERERWRVINACTSRYLRLDLPGQDGRVLGVDGGPEPESQGLGEVLLAPGNRADLLVTMSTGTSTLGSVGYDRGSLMMGMMGGPSGALSGPMSLATLTVAGETSEPLGPVPLLRGPALDLRGREVTRPADRLHDCDGSDDERRGPGRDMMGFDGLSFDANRLDQQVTTGSVEEWTISNPTGMDHPFHLHVWPMQVLEQSGTVLERPTWRDVVNVPARGQVRVLVDFSGHSGRTVYHCHILDHEDAGMMGTVEVAPSA